MIFLFSHPEPPLIVNFPMIFPRFSPCFTTPCPYRSRLHDVDAPRGMARYQEAIAQGDGREAEDRTVRHRQTWELFRAKPCGKRTKNDGKPNRFNG